MKFNEGWNGSTEEAWDGFISDEGWDGFISDEGWEV